MRTILDTHEAEVNEAKAEQRRSKNSTLSSLDKLYKLLNGRDQVSIEDDDTTLEKAQELEVAEPANT